MPSFATPYWRQKSTTRFNVASLLSSYIPRQRCVMRPIGETCVASVMSSPAAPIAHWPRCMRCQSFAEPCLELYWHIGETTMRLGSVRPRSCNGAKSALVIRWEEWVGGSDRRGILAGRGRVKALKQVTLIDGAAAG